MGRVRAFFGTGLAIALVLSMGGSAYAEMLTRQLQFGMSGSDVGTLQSFLAKDASIYPQGLVTSYFGYLTKSAVSNFQVRNGISAVGRVGPITLVAINAQMGNPVVNTDTTEGAGKRTNYGPQQPTLSGIVATPTVNSATITWNSNMAATPRVMYSTVWPFNYQTAASVTNTAVFANAQSVLIGNLQSNTTYFYVVESLDAQGNFSWSTNPSSFKTQ